MSEYCEFQWSDAHYKFRGFSHNNTNNNKSCNINWNEPTDRNIALANLKERIGASMDFALKDKSCCQDDEFLLRFLFARKFNVDNAFQLIIDYHAYRQRNCVILQRLSVLDENIQMSLRDGFPGVLKDRDRRGRKVLVFFAANWDHCHYSLISVYRAMLLSLEKLLDDKQNQANGFVCIVDWTNFTLRQSSHLNPKILKLMIEGLQVRVFLFVNILFLNGGFIKFYIAIFWKLSITLDSRNFHDPPQSVMIIKIGNFNFF